MTPRSEAPLTDGASLFKGKIVAPTRSGRADNHVINLAGLDSFFH